MGLGRYFGAQNKALKMMGGLHRRRDELRSLEPNSKDEPCLMIQTPTLPLPMR